MRSVKVVTLHVPTHTIVKTIDTENFIIPFKMYTVMLVLELLQFTGLLTYASGIENVGSFSYKSE